jgi:two-component system response regulator RegA
MMNLISGSAWDEPLKKGIIRYFRQGTMRKQCRSSGGKCPRWLRMPGKSGLELIKDALAIYPDMRIVVLTGYGSIATATDAVKLGAVSYLPKPADIDDIITAFTQTTDLDLPEPEENFQAPSLARMEWEHINRVLHDCKGNISAAAKKLGLHRRTLQRKLNKFPPDN